MSSGGRNITQQFRRKASSSVLVAGRAGVATEQLVGGDADFVRTCGVLRSQLLLIERTLGATRERFSVQLNGDDGVEGRDIKEVDRVLSDVSSTLLAVKQLLPKLSCRSQQVSLLVFMGLRAADNCLSSASTWIITVRWWRCWR